MSLIQSEENRCLSTLRKLQDARAKLETEALADEAKLRELRASLGAAELSALLEGADAGPVRRQIADLEAKLAGSEAARPQLLTRIRAAIIALGQARAEPVRKQAAKLQKEYEVHVAETARLLKTLEVHSGARWEMALRPIIPPGTSYAPNELPVSPPPVSMRMGAEIQALLAKADQIEAAGAQNHGGRISGATLADLLNCCGSIEQLAPTRASIEAWYSAATARADADWSRTMEDYPNGGAPGREVSFALAWTADGSVDPAHSAVQNRAVNDLEAARRAMAALMSKNQVGIGFGVRPPG
jgi:hypothetical protein